VCTLHDCAPTIDTRRRRLSGGWSSPSSGLLPPTCPAPGLPQGTGYTRDDLSGWPQTIGRHRRSDVTHWPNHRLTVKPSAQPTLVRIQHLPPPAEFAPGLHICGQTLALTPPRGSRLVPAIGGCMRNHGETASSLVRVQECGVDTAVPELARDRRCIRRRHGAGPQHRAQRGGRPPERARQFSVTPLCRRS
jgi:hypothetical protein